jgi:hypothetical protein
MNPITSATSTVSQEMLAILQGQMTRYSQSANGQDGQATADYKALQTAIKSGNFSEAQSDLVRLLHDSQSKLPATAPPSLDSTSPADAADADPAPAQPWNDRSLNLTA